MLFTGIHFPPDCNNEKYLLIGGLADTVNSFIAGTNIVKLRTIQRNTRAFYADDALKYETNNKKLKIRRIYEMFSYNMGNKKEHVAFQDIEDKRGKRFSDLRWDRPGYCAIFTPVFPLTQAVGKISLSAI